MSAKIVLEDYFSRNGHNLPVALGATNSSNSPNSEVAKNSSSNSTLPNNAENRSAEYHKLIEYGLHETVAARLEEIYKTGKLMNLEYFVSKLFEWKLSFIALETVVEKYSF